MLPGPVTRLTGAQPGSSARASVPYANMATAWAPCGGVHLVDAEQGAGGEDRRVRQSAELLLRGRGYGQALDTGLLRRDDVHHDGGRVDGAAARHVQADALDRDPLLGDRAAGDDLGGVRGAALLAVDEAGAPDGLLEGGPDGRVELFEGTADRLGGHAQARDPHMVEFLAIVDHCRRATMPHVLADRPHRLQGGFHVELGTGQQVAQGGTLGEGFVAQIDSRDHGSILADGTTAPVACITG